MNNPDEQLRAIIDTIPALVWSAQPDRSGEFFNRHWLDYAGLSDDEARDWSWEQIIGDFSSEQIRMLYPPLSVLACDDFLSSSEGSVPAQSIMRSHPGP
jgi:PAS domain-containing protein